MRLEKPLSNVAKGWYFGPWNTDSTISVGYANEGVDEPHYHRRMTEIYLMARGVATMQVDGRPVALEAGDVIVIEPGEVHTFLHASPDHFHFVIQTPGLAGDEAVADKVVIATAPGLPPPT